ncbi:hypothetical protein WA158_003020 [Blastocystis sp. Blastoise]
MSEIKEGASLLSTVTNLFVQAISTAYPCMLSKLPINAQVAQNTNSKMKHDYQCNAALSLLKTLKTEMGAEAPKNPREVAQSIMNSMPQEAIIGKLEIAGPGFINFYLNKEWVSESVKKILTRGVVPPPIEKKRVIIDYSSPNIAKDMHVGHLRSTIIGDSLARILEFAGHDVIRINHVGDWGTQFGMLISHLNDIAPDFETNPPSIQDLTVFYKEAKKKFDEDESFKKRSQEEVVHLQSGDERDIKMWKTLCSISEQMFRKVYDLLHIDQRLEVKGESFYNPLLPSVVEELTEKGLIKEDDGALVFFPKGFDVPLIVKKRDGGYGYDSTDLCAIRYRIQEQKADWIIYVVDSGQALHFQQVFAGAREAGWFDRADGKEVRVDHVGFGVVQGEDKKKFKTRAGKSVRLIDLLDEARERAIGILNQRVEQGISSLTDPKDIEFAGSQLGYGGVKYFDLRQNRLSDYIFNFDRMLTPDGDTNVYMQYSHARIQSIINKCNVPIEELAKNNAIHLNEDAEWDLACYLLRFQDTLEAVYSDLLPNRICKYLYDLSQKLNAFYRDCRVIGTEEQDSRLLLCAASEKIMRQGFELLGIVPLDKI